VGEVRVGLAHEGVRTMRMHCNCAKPQPGLALVNGGLSFLCAATGPDRPAQNSMDERSVRPLTSSCPCAAALHRRLFGAPRGSPPPHSTQHRFPVQQRISAAPALCRGPPQWRVCRLAQTEP
jgi:hypothetical protein